MEHCGKLLWFTIMILHLASFYANEVVVETSIGKVLGVKHENYYSFESIPYAEAPIGDLRFESPKPYSKFWKDDAYNATVQPPECIQWDHWVFDENKLHGSEDCLYLNVYTPYIGENSHSLYPVIVFIHGGAFMFGSGSFLKPDLLMNAVEVVFVNFNYRLGPMGFLSTQDEEIPGNMGLKDQQMALKWIKENIESFHGDPDQISLTGFSAGGTSVHFHLLSKQTEDLRLKSAVSFSGTATVPWAIVKDPLERTMKLAELLKCPTTPTKNLKACLKSLSAENIVSNVNGLQTFLFYPFTVFGPVVEPSNIVDAFLIEDPEKIIKNGETVDVPWLASYVKDEGGYPAAELLRNMSDGQIYLTEFLEKFDELAPVGLFFDKISNEDERKSYIEYLKSIYHIGDGKDIFENYAFVQQMFTNELYIKGILSSVKNHRDHSKSEGYLYIYNNPAEFGLGHILGNQTENYFDNHNLIGVLSRRYFPDLL